VSQTAHAEFGKRTAGRQTALHRDAGVNDMRTVGQCVNRQPQLGGLFDMPARQSPCALIHPEISRRDRHAARSAGDFLDLITRGSASDSTGGTYPGL